MKKHTFIMGALILTVGGFVAKIIGAFYKIPLTNALGTEGMGLYYLVFPLYSTMLVFSSSGVGIAVTKLVSEARANKQKRNETMYFKAGLFLSFFSSMIFAILLIVLSDLIASLQGNSLAGPSYVAIAPALVSASVIAVIKGYFQGVENMFPSSIAIIFEQIFKLIVGLFFAYKFLRIGVEYAVFGSVLAVSISELVTMIIMFVNYAWHKKKNDYKFYVRDEKTLKLKELKRISMIKKIRNIRLGTVKRRKRIPIWVIDLSGKRKSRVKIKVLYFYSSNTLVSFKTAMVKTLNILLPNTLSSLVIPFLTLFDSFVVINLLVSAGFSSQIATSLYGLSSGVVSALIALPVIITSALASSTMPNLSGLYSVGRVGEVTERSSFFIKLTFVIILPLFIFFVLFAPDIIRLLYNFNANSIFNEFAYAYKLLRIASVGIIYNALLGTFVSIMQVVGKSYKAFCLMLVAMVVRVMLTLIMLQFPNINIFGVVVANILFYLIFDILCVLEIRKTLNIVINYKKSVLVPMLSCLISCGCCLMLKKLLKNINLWLYLAVNGIVCIVVYFSFLLFLKCFSKSESRYFPFGKKIDITKPRYR